MRTRAELDATPGRRVLHGILEQRVDGEHDLVAIEQGPSDSALIEHELDIEEVHPAGVDLFEQRVDVRRNSHCMVWRRGPLE
jgi:stress response protein YsnF